MDRHLSAGADPGPAGRLHRLWRLFGSRSPASRSLRLDARPWRWRRISSVSPTRRISTPSPARYATFGANAPHPLAAAAGAGVAAVEALEGAPPVDVETFSLWAADLAPAQNFGWDAPVPLLATTIAQPALRRGGSGKRPRPGDLDWVEAAAFAYALAAQDAHALAGELARRAEKLLAAVLTLRAKRASRVVELLLSNDALSPARAAKAAGLSDRAGRRLFDRLVELGAARELTGRPSWTLGGAMSGSRRSEQPAGWFDRELADLPDGARWREWMGRIEAAIFAARDPLPREALAKLVGDACRLDDLIADIVDELRVRPYELVFVAGGYQLRTKPRFAEAIRAASSGTARDAGLPELTPTELLTVTAIAYLQPATRAEISRFDGREISRDVIARLKRVDLVDAGLRARPLDRRACAGSGTGDELRALSHVSKWRFRNAANGGAPASHNAVGACGRSRRGSCFEAAHVATPL